MTISQPGAVQRTALWQLTSRLRRQDFTTLGGDRIAIAAAISLVAVYVWLVWRPLEAARIVAHSAIERESRVFAALRRVTPADAESAIGRASPFIKVVTGKAAHAQIAMTGVRLVGDVMFIDLPDTDFGRLVSWLDDLERGAGIRASRIDIRKGSTPGLVEVQLVLAR
ncbi:MAG: type II secretion system protein GspM [Janthinobacterium lividum]